MTTHLLLLLLAVSAAQPLTVEDAVNRALENHPAAVAALAAVEEEKGNAVQAGLPPNPELGLEMEGWRNTGKDDSEYELLMGLTQPLPLSGARRTAKQAGMVGADAAAREADALRFDIAGNARTLFYNVLAAQQKQALLEAMAANAEALASLTRTRVEQGDLPEVDLMRVVAEQHRYAAERDRTQKEYEGLCAQLTELCGLNTDSFPECIGALAPESSTLPEAAALEARLRETPADAARRLRAEQAQTMDSAVQRSALPEPSLHVGFRRDSGDNESSLDLGVSVELPLFDRKQGAKAAARAREQRIRAENEATLRDQLRSALALRSEAEAALTEADLLRNSVLPQLEAVGAVMVNAQALGGAALFETLAAQRDIAETRLALLESEGRARAALTALETLLGQP